MAFPTIEFLHGGATFDPLFTLDLTVALASQTSASVTEIVFDDPTLGGKIIILGNFVIDSGNVVGGSMTGFMVFSGLTPVMAGDGFLLAATDLLATLPDPNAFFELVFANTKQIGSSDADFMQAVSGVVLGKAGGDQLFGGDGSTVMKGGKGADVLYDSLGFNDMTGGKGHDTFMFGCSCTADFVRDFDPQRDTIGLDVFAYSAIGPGFLGKEEFIKGASALTPDQHVIYNDLTGQLFYDDDGSGPNAPELIATLGTGLKIHADNIVGVISI